jgi:hypothetical protein
MPFLDFLFSYQNKDKKLYVLLPLILIVHHMCSWIFIAFIYNLLCQSRCLCEHGDDPAILFSQLKAHALSNQPSCVYNHIKPSRHKRLT